MPDIHLIMSDAALAEAIAEQIATFRLGQVFVSDGAFSPDAGSGALDGAVFVVGPENTRGAVRDLVGKLGADKHHAVVLAIAKGQDNGDEIEGTSETFALPLRLGHLVSRIRHYTQTAPLLRNKPVSFGPYVLDPQSRSVARGGGCDRIRLTEKETALLLFLAQKKFPATKQEILAAVWGYDDRIDTRTLETHVYLLRKKLDQEGENWLVSDRGAYGLAGLE